MPYPKASYAWLVVGVLALASVVSFIDRQIVALLVEPIQQDLGVNDTEAGWLFGAFAIFYSLGGLPIAYVADRYSRKWVIAAGVFLWSLMTIGCGLARSFAVLFAARIGVGVGEATLVPCTHSLVGDYFPREKIPLAIAVFQMAATFGTGLAFTIGGLIVELVRYAPPVDAGPLGLLKPWQLAFLCAGAPGFVVLVLVLMIREPKRRGVIDTYAGKAMGTAALFAFYRRNWKAMATHHLGYAIIALVGYSIVFWTPTFFQRIHGIPAGVAGVYWGLYFLIFATAGVYYGGRLGERMIRAGHKDGAIRATILGGCAMIPLGIVTPLMPWPELSWALYAPLMFFVNVHSGLGPGALPVIVPSQMRAQAAAIYGMTVAAIGMGLGPVLTGAISDYVFPQDHGVRYSLVLMMVICGPLWVVLLGACRPHYRRSFEDAETLEQTGGIS
ncbi:MAG: spinster family MFS transporter [Sphingomonadales bacterium]